jgi:hypothetical protein
MKRLSVISNNRALLVLCAFGLSCASSALGSARAVAGEPTVTSVGIPIPFGDARSVARPGNQIDTGTKGNKKTGTDGQRTNRGVSDNNSPIPQDRIGGAVQVLGSPGRSKSK